MLRLTLTLFSFLMALSCMANKSLIIVGTIFACGEVCEEATVQIYDENSDFEMTVTPTEGNFLVSIPKDMEVILSIEKSGFCSKQVVVDTSAENYPEDKMTFFCDVSLIEEHVLQNIDAELLERPLGIVYFNSVERLFVLDKFYTQLRKRDIRNQKKKLRKRRKFQIFKC